jgi:hypothetical protein
MGRAKYFWILFTIKLKRNNLRHELKKYMLKRAFNIPLNKLLTKLTPYLIGCQIYCYYCLLLIVLFLFIWIVNCFVYLELKIRLWFGSNNFRYSECKNNYILFHISSKFDFFIGVDMVMCHALICVKEIHQSLTW